MPKPVYRDVADTSVRNMLSTAAGMIVSHCIIGDVPVGREFKEDASEGAKLSRQILAEAHNVPVERINFVAREMIFSTDDMASQYVYEGGENEVETEKQLVRTESIKHNTSYGVHVLAANSSSGNQLKGIKGRFTTTLCAGGVMAPIFIQFPVFTEEEIPRDTVPEGIIVLKVKGLTPVSK